MQANEPAIPANFARGLDQEPVDPADEIVGSFATGEETQPHDHRRQRRFSEGLEAVRDAPEKAACATSPRARSTAMPARDNQAMGARLRDALWSGPRALRLDPVRPIELFDAWLFAENDATVALGTWFAAPSDRRADAYAAYVAALDREAQGAEVLRRRLTTG